MIAFVTYCSGSKRGDPEDIPAIERYDSPRIRSGQAAAAERGADFFILSGKFGLLLPDEPIPYYDHLLAEDEVDAMTKDVLPKLRNYRKIIFYSKKGDFIAPYHMVIDQCASRLGCEIELMEM